jgi:cell division protein FtsB
VRRGSLGFKVSRIAGKPAGRAARIARAKRWNRWLNAAGRIVVLATVLLVGAAFGTQAWHIGYQNYQLHKQIDAVESQNRALEARSVTLRKQILYSHNPEYLVPLIHEQLGLTKPNEVFIQIAPAPK